MPPGLSTHLEIQLMIKAGVSPTKVLQAATINAATALNISDKYGSVEVGKIADLVVVHDNPLENMRALSDPFAVIKAGQWISDKELSVLQKAGERPSNIYISMGRLLEDLLVRIIQ